jgi:rare lipoprotein A (peptidoglycan hydrolase)
MRIPLLLLLLQPITPAIAGGRHVTATVYDSWYHGRQTACGGTYRHWGVSAAHPWLSCGTRVRVSHQGLSLIHI